MRRSGNGMSRYQDLEEVSGGPLMTNHLKNLNKELELLRRKREAIQQEQNLLTLDINFDRKRPYQQALYDCSQLYGNIGYYQNRDGWDDEPPFKQQNYRPKPRPISMQTQNIPSLLSKDFRMPVPNNSSLNHGIRSGIAHKPIKPSFKPQRNFGIVKAAKKKPVTPNKLNSYPVEERKNLVSKVIEQDKAPQKTDKVFILREGEVPTQQMTGRLELALGCIVKEIKASNVNNALFNNCLTNVAYQRILKQVVRERIRSVMLNQSVGPVAEIVQKYREKFPQDTDQEIVNVVMASQTPKSSMAIVEAEDPEEFFKANITTMVEKKMDEMFTTLYKIYSNSNRKAGLCYAKLDENDDRETTEEVAKEKDLPHAQHAMEIIEKIIGKPLLIEEKNVLSKYFKEMLQNFLDENIPAVLPKFTKHIMKILDIDNEYKSIKNMTMKKIREFERTMSVRAVPAKATPKNYRQIKKPNDIQETNDIQKPNDIQELKDKQETQKENLELENKTPVDESMNVQATSNEKQPIEVADDGDNNNPPSTPAPQQVVTPATPSTPMRKELPYFIKLIGNPNLPSRAVIYDFLNGFSPASIRKHKSINNLLVVGLTNQNDYDKILLADGTVFGDSSITIKASEKVNIAKENKDENTPKNDTDSNQDMGEAKPAEQETLKKQEVPIKSNMVDEIKDSPLIVKTEVKQVAIEDIKMETQTEDANTESENSTDIIEVKKEVKPQIIESISEVDENEENKSNKDTQNVSEAEQSAEAGDADKGPVTTFKDTEASGRATPTRSSSRLANVTPSSIRTRRASRLLQN